MTDHFIGSRGVVVLIQSDNAVGVHANESRGEAPYRPLRCRDHDRDVVSVTVATYTRVSFPGNLKKSFFHEPEGAIESTLGCKQVVIT